MAPRKHTLKFRRVARKLSIKIKMPFNATPIKIPPATFGMKQANFKVKYGKVILQSNLFLRKEVIRR